MPDKNAASPQDIYSEDVENLVAFLVSDQASHRLSKIVTFNEEL